MKTSPRATMIVLKSRLERTPEDLRYDDADVSAFIELVEHGKIKFFNGPMTSWAVNHLLDRDASPAPYLRVLMPFARFGQFPYLGCLT